MATELKVGMKVRRSKFNAEGTVINVHNMYGVEFAEIDYGVWGTWKFKSNELELVPEDCAAEPKFKVGDRVRTKGYEGTHWDGEGTVAEPGGICNIVLINGERGGFFDHELELVATTTPPRLGRRYRTCSGVKTGPVQFGMEAEVDGHMRVYDKAGGHVFGEAELDLVEELPLVVRKGGYYRTRDGRKVGPISKMDFGDGYPFEAGAGWWVSPSGKAQQGSSGGDLIAEWVDEPSASEAPTATNDNTPTPTTGFTVPLCAYDDDTVDLTALGRAYLSGWRDAQQAQAA